MSRRSKKMVPSLEQADEQDAAGAQQSTQHEKDKRLRIKLTGFDKEGWQKDDFNQHNYWLKGFSITRKLTRNQLSDHKDIAEIIQEHFQSLKGSWWSTTVELIGSSGNGFGLNDCEVDISLFIPSKVEVNDELFEELCMNLGNLEDVNKSSVVVEKRTPNTVIKFEFQIPTSYDCYTVNLSVNNRLAVVNTSLLRSYTQIEPKAGMVGVLVKHFVKTVGIDNSSGDSVPLSSYAYSLMVIHYLQRRSILAVLQKIGDYKTHEVKRVDGWDTWFSFEHIKSAWREGYGSNVRPPIDSVFGLLLSFFEYFEDFDWKSSVVTTHEDVTETHPDKVSRNWQDSVACIQDPFNHNHNLAAAVTEEGLELLLSIFKLIRGFLRYWASLPGDLDDKRDILFDKELILDPNTVAPHFYYY